MRKHTQYITFALFALFLAPLTSKAQIHSPHEISVWGNIGSSALNSSMNKGKSKSQMGFGGGVGYTYFFTSELGIHSGFEISAYKNEYSLINLKDKYVTDFMGDALELSYTMEKHKENATVMLLQIPIMFQYQTPSEMHRFYVMAGGKIGLPIKKETSIDASQFTTVGYLPHANLTLTKPNYYGFGTFDRAKTTADIHVKTAFLLSVEAGVKWRLTEQMSLLTGAYLDYGVNNILKDVDKRLVEYNTENPAEYIYNSIVDSRYHSEKEGKDNYFVKNMKPFSVGAKIRLSFSMGGDTGYKRQKRKGQIREKHMDTYQRDYKQYKESDVKEDSGTIRRRVEETEQKTMTIDLKDLVKDYMDNTKNKTKGYRKK